MFVVQRSSHNPKISPINEHPWEAQATYNWSPVSDGGTIHALYRAQAKVGVLGEPGFSASTIGYVSSTDGGKHFEGRRQFIVPEFPWERYGCEDPRITKIDDTYYIFYTALSRFPFSWEGIRVACATTKDFVTIDERFEVTPFNAKAMSLFPEKVNGKYAIIVTVNTDLPPSRMSIRYFDSLEDLKDKKAWMNWYNELDQWAIEDPVRNREEHAEVGAQPIYTKEGWLLVYSHIQKYFTEQKIFGIEALLLDHDNPQHIVGHTRGPFIVPERTYEKYGYMPNIVFPSGALVRGEMLDVYYGATDMTCCTASVHLQDLIDAMTPTRRDSYVVRSIGNPILRPIPEHEWEGKLVFNPGALDIDGDVHIIYRAMSADNTSYLGYARSHDGKHIDERHPTPAYWPREEFEMKKSHPTGNSGCEDPRLVLIDGFIYLSYTAYDGVNPPRVAISKILKEDFLAKHWDAWSKPILFTPPGVDDKDTCLFPEMIKGKYMILHRIQNRICGDFIDTLDFGNERVTRCIEMIGPRPGMWDGEKVGIAGPPFKTDAGWILLYHGVSSKSVYRVGAVLFDPHNPEQVIARTTNPIFEPREPYELYGEIKNVVFPCGQVVRGDTLYIYYGGADTVIGVATARISQILEHLTRHEKTKIDEY